MFADLNSNSQYAFEDLNWRPPLRGGVKDTELTLDITQLDISGNFVVEMIDILDEFFRDFINDFLGGRFRDEIHEQLQNFHQGILNTTLELEDYYLEITAGDIDVLQAEKDLIEETNNQDVCLWDFKDDTQKILGFSFNDISALTDGLGEIDEEEEDLGINVLLVNNCILEDDGSFLLEPYASLFNGVNTTLNAELILNKGVVYGLDSFKTFNLLNTVGSHTFRNTIHIGKLDFELDFTMRLKSTQRGLGLDTVIDLSDDYEKNFTVSAGVEDLSLDISLMIGVDRDMVNEIQMHSLMNQTCAMGLLPQFNLTQLEYKMLDYTVPEVDGVIADGIDQYIRSVIDSQEMLYKSFIKYALPNYVATEVLEMVNNGTGEAIFNASTEDCPSFSSSGTTGSFIDFRDFLWNETEAPGRGGSGEMPYGDIPPMLYTNLTSMFMMVNETDHLAINTWIQELCSYQSYQAIVIEEPVQCVSDLESTNEKLELKVTNVTIKDIDSFGIPLRILDTRTNDPYVLDQEISFGALKPIEIIAFFDFSFREESASDYKFRNIFSVSLKITNVKAMGSILAKIRADEFMNMRLMNGMNPYCILDTIPLPELNENYLSWFDVAISYEDVEISLDCISCSTDNFSQLISNQNLNSTVNQLANEFMKIAIDAVQEFDYQKIIDGVHYNASRICSEYPNENGQSFMAALISDSGVVGGDDDTDDDTEDILDCIETIRPENITREQFESIINYALNIDTNIEASEPSDPLSEQKKGSPEGALAFVDSTTDFGIYLNEIFANVSDALSGENSEDVVAGLEDLPINKQLRSLFEKTEGKIDLSDNAIFVEDFELTYVKFIGYDTFEVFDPLNIIGQQTIQTLIGIQQLILEFGVIIHPSNFTTAVLGIETETPVQVQIGFEDINLTAAVFMDINEELFSNLPIGPLLDMFVSFEKPGVACTLGTIRNVVLTQFYFQIANFMGITIIGLEDDFGISDLSKSITAIYKSMLSLAIPTVFDGPLREYINDELLPMAMQITEAFSQMPSCYKIKKPSSDDGFIDFRDMFLDNETAYQLGASGTYPYGDLVLTGITFANNTVNGPYEDLKDIRDTEDVAYANVNTFFNDTMIIEDYIANVSFDFDKISKADHNLKVQVYDVKAENLHSITNPVTFLSPRYNDSHVLDNSIHIKTPEDHPITVSLFVYFSLVGKNTNINDHVKITLKLRSASVDLSVKALVDQKAFQSLTVKTVLMNPMCGITTIPIARSLDSNTDDDMGSANQVMEETFELKPHIYDIEASVDIQCLSCSSKQFEMFKRDQDMSVFAQHLSCILLGQVVESQERNIREMIYDQELRRECMSEDYDVKANGIEELPNTKDFIFDTTPYGISSVSLFMLFFSTGMFIYFITRRILLQKQNSWFLSRTEDELLKLFSDKMKEDQLEDRLNKNTLSIFQSSHCVKPIYRYGVIVSIGINTYLFVVAHIGVSNVVGISGSVGGDDFDITPFYESFGWRFAWNNMTVEGGSKPLGYILLISSIIWPYLKLLATLLLWFLPPRFCSIKRRGWWLETLDSLAKWSMIDIFSTFFAVIMFRFVFKNPTVDFFPEDDFYQVYLIMILREGMYCNLAAQVVTQLTAHVVVYSHNLVRKDGLKEIEAENMEEILSQKSKSTKSHSTANLSVSPKQLKQKNKDLRSNFKDTKPSSRYHIELDDKKYHGNMEIDYAEGVSIQPDEKDPSYSDSTAFLGSDIHDEKVVLNQHTFRLREYDEEGTAKVRESTNLFVLVLGIITLILIVVECIVPCFRIESYGLIAALIRLGGQSSDTYYSLFSVAASLMSAFAYLESPAITFGMFLWSLAMVLTAFVAPFLIVVLLLYVWFRPLNYTQRSKIETYVHLLMCWSYVEVFVISILITVWTGAALVQVTLDRQCWALHENFFPTLVTGGIIPEAESRCIAITNRPQLGMYLMILTAALVTLLINFVLGALAQQMEDLEFMKKQQDNFKVFGDATLDTSDASSMADNLDIKDEKFFIKLSKRLQNSPSYFTDTYGVFLMKSPRKK